MRASQLYESPFTDFSPKGVEGVFNTIDRTRINTRIYRPDWDRPSYVTFFRPEGL